jgi:hypothetical protein
MLDTTTGRMAVCSFLAFVFSAWLGMGCRARFGTGACVGLSEGEAAHPLGKPDEHYAPSSLGAAVKRGGVPAARWTVGEHARGRSEERVMGGPVEIDNSRFCHCTPRRSVTGSCTKHV